MKPRHPTTIANLRDEVLSNIFIRLFAKEVAQMRSVCKPWNALLSDSSFIKSHLHHSIQNNDEILLFIDAMFSLERNPFTARTSRSPDLELTNLIKPPVIPNCYGRGVLIGSVNVLICFRYGSGHVDIVIHIWNPSLSAMLSLPRLPLGSHLSHFGFGFDPKTYDYKILKLTTLLEPPDEVVQGEVYNMRKGSWKLISPQTFPLHITIPGGYDNQVCVDDHLHWIGHTVSKWKPDTIVAFDLVAETFHEIPLPDSILNPHEDCLNVVGVLLGKLCVMSCVAGGECEVWVMDEYGVLESWFKHHAFSQFSGDIFPSGFTSHGEFLFQVSREDERFGLCDPVAAKTKTFNIMSRRTSVMKFVEYVDSLVWVPPPNREL